MLSTANHQNSSPGWLRLLQGPLHRQMLWLFMVIVLGHWLEHLTQIYQIYAMGWMPKAAGGVLGLWFPWLATSEVLHSVYNLLLWGGILLLQPGFHGAARRWWNIALLVQSWHFFEHILLQVQWLTGVYIFGASKQISIGELWFPRPELHFVYNLLVFAPLVIGMYLYFRPPADGEEPATGLLQT